MQPILGTRIMIVLEVHNIRCNMRNRELESSCYLIFLIIHIGLRKVTSDMQTHKNPQLRKGPAPFKPAASSAPLKALPQPGAGTLPDKPPVFTRDGKKWLIVCIVLTTFDLLYSTSILLNPGFCLTSQTR